MKKKVFDAISENIIGKEITLSGVAFDSKAGAVLKLRDNNIVYIQDLSSWSSEVIGTKNLAIGTLQKKKMILDPKIDENGAISQGAYGEQYVLENRKEIQKTP
ncbi:MAG TPA: hypothetical protein VMV49_18150 [Candidatus Deferrimicrobium sp.]|nr:hypothetical protein [Candidatus Deferrimicrobium sp.]